MFQTLQLWPMSPSCFLFGSDLLISEYPEIELHVSSFSGKLFITPNSIDPSGLWTKNKTGHQEFVTICLSTYLFILLLQLKMLWMLLAFYQLGKRHDLVKHIRLMQFYRHSPLQPPFAFSNDRSLARHFQYPDTTLIEVNAVLVKCSA